MSEHSFHGEDPLLYHGTLVGHSNRHVTALSERAAINEKNGEAPHTISLQLHRTYHQDLEMLQRRMPSYACRVSDTTTTYHISRFTLRHVRRVVDFGYSFVASTFSKCDASGARVGQDMSTNWFRT